jgi:hypothetical protein
MPALFPFQKAINNSLNLQIIQPDMDHLILNIKDKSKLSFLMEILKRMEFVEVVTPDKFTAKEKKILSDLEDAVTQVKLHKEGKIQLKTIQQVLDEL